MLGKLLKYEFKAFGRIMLPAYIAVIILCLITTLFFNENTIGNAYHSNVYMVSIIILLFLFILLTSASVVLCLFIVALRFKDDIFGKSGYLMNTLPVKTSYLIISKLIVAIFCEIISIAIALLAIIIFAFKTQNISIDMAYIHSLTSYHYIIAFKILVLFLLYIIDTYLKIYCAISIGHSANNHKILKSFAAYIIFYFIQNIINYIILIIFAIAKGDFSNVTQDFYNPYFTLTFTLEIIYILIYYFITHYFIKNKLNLQ